MSARGPVRGISLKLQEEEREKRMDFAPEVSQVDQQIMDQGVEVDEDTLAMLAAMDMANISHLKKVQVQLPQATQQPCFHLKLTFLFLLNGSMPTAARGQRWEGPLVRGLWTARLVPQKPSVLTFPVKKKFILVSRSGDGEPGTGGKTFVNWKQSPL